MILLSSHRNALSFATATHSLLPLYDARFLSTFSVQSYLGFLYSLIISNPVNTYIEHDMTWWGMYTD